MSEFRAESVDDVQSRPDAVALRAGLFLVHDRLDESHAESQSVEGAGRRAAGDYWHAVMHRREPDYGNSKYWFRRVGRHPHFPELAARAEALLGDVERALADQLRERLGLAGNWNPFAFVDLCEECAIDEESETAQITRHIQWAEMLLLLKHTCRDAFGETEN